MTITEAENAAVTCHVFLVGQSDKAESATANVTTLGKIFNLLLTYFVIIKL